jgi:predicted house-cleaning noncanonical NTP pyrophosphatase (MazG superfamily)
MSLAFSHGRNRGSKKFSLPVELAGSTLSHAFYQLQQSGVVVYCIDPFSSYERVRQRKVFEKLVRDEIPAQIASKGERVVQSAITAGDAPKALLAKLIEEALEFTNAQTTSERREELADLYEVLRAIANVNGFQFEEIVSTANVKRGKRGGFGKLLMLRETSLPKNPSFQHMGPEVRPVTLSKIGTSLVKRK